MVPEIPDWLQALHRSNPLLLGATIGVVIAAAFSTLQQIMAIGSSRRWSPEGKVGRPDFSLMVLNSLRVFPSNRMSSSPAARKAWGSLWRCFSLKVERM